MQGRAGPGRAESTEPAAPRGKEFPADSARCRFLSASLRCLTLPARDAPRPPGPLAVPGSAPGPMQSRLLLLGAPGGHGGPASRRMRLLLRQVVQRRPGGDRQRPEVRLVHAGSGADTGNSGCAPALPGAPALRAGPPRAVAPPLCCFAALGRTVCRSGSSKIEVLVPPSALTAV